MNTDHKAYCMKTVFIFLLSGLSVLDAIAKDIPTLPESIKKEMQFLEGHWTFITEQNGEPKTGHYTARWASRGTCLLMTFRSDSDNSTGVSSWDAATNEIVENWFDPTAGRLELRYKVTSATEWEGTSKRVTMDGKISNGKLRIIKNGRNSFRYTEKTGGLTWEIDNKRILRPMNSQQSSTAELAAFIGVWEATSEKGTRRWTFEWSPEKDFINNQQTVLDTEGQQIWTINGSLGWDQGIGQITNWCVWGGGGKTTFFWKKLSQDMWESSTESAEKTWKFTAGSSKLRMIDSDGTETIFTKQ